MSRPRYYHFEPSEMRKLITKTMNTADDFLLMEQKLIHELAQIDFNRFYVYAGYNSLRGFCEKSLRMGRTQSQRITTEVRRYQTTVNFQQKEYTLPQRNPKDWRKKEQKINLLKLSLLSSNSATTQCAEN